MIVSHLSSARAPYRLVAASLLLLTLAGCVAPRQAPAPPSAAERVAWVSAHRGGAAYAPENTLLAFHNAVRLGVDDLEADVVLTADAVAVLHHDDTLERTTNCRGRVDARTFAELQRCDAAYWWTPGQATTLPDVDVEHPLRGQGIRVPTVQALLAYVAGLPEVGRPSVTLEIKSRDPDALDGQHLARVLLPLIRNSGIASRVIVQSLDAAALAVVKQLDPTIRTLRLSMRGQTFDPADAQDAAHEWLGPQWSEMSVDARSVAHAHALGKQVATWTPDRKKDLRLMQGFGVDAIVTNYPACLLALQGRPVPERLVPAQAGSVALTRCPATP